MGKREKREKREKLEKLVARLLFDRVTQLKRAPRLAFVAGKNDANHTRCLYSIRFLEASIGRRIMIEIQWNMTQATDSDYAHVTELSVNENGLG